MMRWRGNLMRMAACYVAGAWLLLMMVGPSVGRGEDAKEILAATGVRGGLSPFVSAANSLLQNTQFAHIIPLRRRGGWLAFLDV